MAEQWFVNWDDAWEHGGQQWLCIGPYENDQADAFAFSATFAEHPGAPDDLECKFRLMAAAPDLLAACKLALAGGSAADWERSQEAMKAAIAKAEGGGNG